MEKDGTTLVMPDITKGCMLVTIYGSEIALIENFKSIIEYSDSIIKLQGKQKRLVYGAVNCQLNDIQKETVKSAEW